MEGERRGRLGSKRGRNEEREKDRKMKGWKRRKGREREGNSTLVVIVKAGPKIACFPTQNV